MSNYDPSLDDDLFDESATLIEDQDRVTHSDTRHRFDGTICGICGVVHPVHADGRPLPPQLEEEFDQLLNSLPPDQAKTVAIVAKVVSPEAGRIANLTSHLVDFLDSWSRAGSDIARDRGLTEVLDELTGGRATILIRFYEYQSQLAFATVVRALLGETITSAETRFGTELRSEQQTLAHTLDLCVEIAAEQVTALSNHYIRASELARIAPDAELLRLAAGDGRNYRAAREALARLTLKPYELSGE